jgi:DNA helicase IV
MDGSPEPHDELAAEQRRLDAAQAAVERSLELMRRGRSDAGTDDFAQEALDRMRAEHVRLYSDRSGPLYFGRLDRESGGEPLYIGRHAVYGPHTELLVINWRAPAAEPFYRATTGRALGIRRRRRFDIEDGIVRGLTDESLSRPETDHLSEAIVEDIVRQRIGEMRQIIATITPDQYELIVAGRDRPLVVQGGPGTGKTAVGLHRVAWLLYSDQALAREGVLVIGPNPTFMRYIAQVLPALGEHSASQQPIGALGDPRPAAAEPGAVAQLKGDRRMATLLERALWARLGRLEEPLQVRLDRREAALATAEVEELMAAVRARDEAYAAGRERFRALLSHRLAARVAETSARARLLPAEDLAAAVRRAPEFRRAEKLWPRQRPEALVKGLLGSPARLRDAAAGVLDEREIEVLASACRRDAPSSRADFALLDEARWLIDRDVRQYGHVVVDEAQDLSAMELRMAARRARAGSLTVLGDIAQRTAAGSAPRWEELLAEAELPACRLEELRVSYRVPEDFIALASRVRSAGVAAPRGVRRAPQPPQALSATPDELGDRVCAVAERLASEVGSVGVVCPDRPWPAVAAALATAGLLHEDADGLGPGVNLLSLPAMKGLEFDAALVVEPVDVLAQADGGGPGALYTALTRSTRALAIVHAQPLPVALASAPELERVSTPPATA